MNNNNNNNKQILNKFNVFYDKLDDLINELTMIKSETKYLKQEQNEEWINDYFKSTTYEEQLIMCNNILEDIISLEYEIYNLSNDIEEIEE